jgi:hypothetical protein
MNHENERVSDYVLGLLAGDEAAKVAGHLSTCTSCRHQAKVERMLIADVRSTIDIASVFDKQKLDSLMPVIPSPNKVAVFAFDPRQFALAMALIVVILGGIIFGIASRHGSWLNNNNSIITATTVVTETPSFTATAASSRDDIQSLSETSEILFLIPALAAPIPRMTPESNGTG